MKTGQIWQLTGAVRPAEHRRLRYSSGVPKGADTARFELVMTAAEKAAFERAASADGLSLAAWIRVACRRALQSTGVTVAPRPVVRPKARAKRG